MAKKKLNLKRIAIVSPLYGSDLSDNLSALCRTFITELKNNFDITVITSCAKNDSTWKNTYLEGEQFTDDTRILRFPVSFERKKNRREGYDKFLSEFWKPGTEEVKWFIDQGPYSPALCNYLHNNYSFYDSIFFLDCESYTTAVCMLGLSNAILIPLVRDKKLLSIFHFKKVFAQPVAFIFQNQEEQDFVYSLFPETKEKPFVLECDKAEELSNLINQVNYTGNKKTSDVWNWDTYINRKLTPAFKKNNIAVVFSSDDRYVYILSVALQSMVEQTSPDWNYDICIISDGIEEKKKDILRLICLGKKNISLRFLEISQLLDTVHLKTWKNRISRTTFARLYIPELFSEYTKVLSLDGDIIVKKDVSELYNIEVGDNYFGAVPDVGLHYRYKFRVYEYKYLERIGILNKDNYFNAGVLLFNINEFKKNYSVASMIEMIAVNKFHFDEQDAFNVFAQNHVKLLPYNWNLFWHVSVLIQEILLLDPEYVEAKKNPYILHYSGGILPITCENPEYASEYWAVARKSPCYELLLNMLIKNYNKDVFPALSKKESTVVWLMKGIRKKIKKYGFIKTIKYCMYRLKYE